MNHLIKLGAACALHAVLFWASAGVADAAPDAGTETRPSVFDLGGW